MSFWSDIGDFFNGIWNHILDAIDDIAKLITNLWTAIKLDIAQALDQAFHGNVFAIVFVITASIFVGIGSYLLTLPGVIVTVAAVNEAVNIAEQIALSIAETVQLAMLIEISQTLSFTDDTWNSQLANLYKALSDLASALNISMAWFIMFADIGRAELMALHSFMPDGVYQSQKAYADGMIKWLNGLSSKLNDYAANPQDIFFDIQAAVIKDQLSKASDAQKTTLAAVAVATSWIAQTGTEIKNQVSLLNSDFARIAPEYEAKIQSDLGPFIKKYDDFINNTFAPFQREYNRIYNLVVSDLQEQGININSILTKLKTPIDLIAFIISGDTNDKVLNSAILNNALAINKKNKLGAIRSKIKDEIQFRNPFLPYDIANPEMPVYTGVESSMPYEVKTPIESHSYESLFDDNDNFTFSDKLISEE